MATYPNPTPGLYNSPAFQTFLGNHPAFARLARTGTRDQVNQFLTNHPDIATRYLALVRPPSAAAAPAAGAATATATASSPPTTPSGAAESARGALASYLRAYGLEGVTDYAWSRYLELGEGSEETILNEIRQNKDGTGTYARIYPGMAELNAQGRSMSEGQYRDAQETYRAAMRSIGLPQEMWDDPTDFAKLIVSGVSGREFDDRLQMVQRAALNDPRGIALREELTNRYGVPNAVGLVTSWFLDPDRSEEQIRRQFTAAQAAAVSRTSGFGSLTTEQAERIGALGLSEPEQAQRFADLAGMRELTSNLPGTQEQQVTQDDLIKAGFEDNADAQQRVRRKTETRVGAFQGGGSFATTAAGISGLGTSNG